MKAIYLPLHKGSVPKWLFEKMVKLSREISEIIILEYGTKKFIELLSNPIWFQAFSNVLGFDWHSSGSTTVAIRALKESLKDFDEIFVFGGKGKEALKTIEEIEKSKIKDKNELKRISRISCKVDNVLLQDGYDLYIHSLIVDRKGNWVVINQGMNVENLYARRYHWSSFDLKDFFEEPHSNILGFKRENFVIDLTSKKSRETRKSIFDLCFEDPNRIQRYVESLKEILKGQRTLFGEIKLPRAHRITIPSRIKRKLETIQRINPKDFEELLMIKGVGKETIRALALISYLLFGTDISFEDPLLFSFAHGGKDGFPFFVKKKVYERSIEILKNVLEDLKVGKREKIEAMKRLSRFVEKGFK